MRSDHLSKHLKTHQAKKVNQQQQSEESASLTVSPNQISMEVEQTDLSISENASDANSELDIQGPQI
jgi:hypothetical protein